MELVLEWNELILEWNGSIFLSGALCRDQYDLSYFCWIT